MKRAAILLSLLPVLFCVPAGAQYIQPSDTVRRVTPHRSDFKPTQLIAPGAMIISSLVINGAFHEQIDYPIRDEVQSWGGNHQMTFDDYLQYLPVAVDLGLAFTGVEADHGFVDRVTEGAIAYITCFAISRTWKYAYNTERPNGVDNISFPSGHTTFAFTGAELVRMEYGNAWGAGAYAVATAVAFMRVYRNWHWFSDVLAGAGIGVLSAHVGGWLLEPAKDLLGIRTSDWGSGRRRQATLAFSPVVDPVSGTICAGMTMKF